MSEVMDKRKHPRIKPRIPLKYFKLGTGPNGSSSVSVNLSQGGIRFRTKEFISMACRLLLEMDIPMLAAPLKVISKVTWIRKTDAGDDYEVGNQFLDISKEDRKLLSEYVDCLNQYAKATHCTLEGGFTTDDELEEEAEYSTEEE